MNTNQSHFNTDVGSNSEFSRPLVVSTLTIAIAIGQSVTDTSQNAFANLRPDKLLLTHPAFDGNTPYSESHVSSKRESDTRSEAEIVTIRHRHRTTRGRWSIRSPTDSGLTWTSL